MSMLISIHPRASSQVGTELTVSHAFIHTHISLHSLALTHSFSNTAAVEVHILISIMSTCTQPSSHSWPSPEGPTWTQQPCPTRAGQCGAALAAGREAGLFYIAAALWSSRAQAMGKGELQRLHREPKATADSGRPIYNTPRLTKCADCTP